MEEGCQLQDSAALRKERSFHLKLHRILDGPHSRSAHLQAQNVPYPWREVAQPSLNSDCATPAPVAWIENGNDIKNVYENMMGWECLGFWVSCVEGLDDIQVI
jgi:hypothetical protein